MTDPWIGKLAGVLNLWLQAVKEVVTLRDISRLEQRPRV